VTAVRALFFGTPAFAVPCLDALAELAEVVGVVCQPDKPAGRGQKDKAPPVKERALALGFSVVQPTKLRTGEFGAWVRAQAVDVALVVAYGRILPADVLQGPRRGCVNVHASLLPKYRGAAPITWAVVHGETESGVTTMVLDEGMDTGPTLAFHRTAVGPDETAGELAERLAQLGADAVRSDLVAWVEGTLAAVPQDHARATMAPVLQKEQGRVDWAVSAKRVHDHVRGMTPWPGAHALYGQESRVKLLGTRVEAGLRDAGPPGRVLMADKSRLLVACGDGAIDLVTVQLEGKRPMRGVDWVMGRGIKQGDELR